MSDVMMLRQIPENDGEGGRLGRHVEHDPRSRQYAYGVVLSPSEYKRVHHRRYGAVLDQGNLGSCTGNATVHAINTRGLHKVPSKTLKKNIAVLLYQRATVIDGFPGEYPPDDTGSSGLAAAKAAVEAGYFSQYKHAFSLEEALSALQQRPVITGVDWYEGFDRPDENGIVKIEGQVRGGHEFCVLGFEPKRNSDDSLVIAQNSWGAQWGKKGKFAFTVATWRQLLDNQGDVTILL